MFSIPLGVSSKCLSATVVIGILKTSQLESIVWRWFLASPYIPEYSWRSEGVRDGEGEPWRRVPPCQTDRVSSTCNTLLPSPAVVWSWGEGAFRLHPRDPLYPPEAVERFRGGSTPLWNTHELLSNTRVTLLSYFEVMVLSVMSLSIWKHPQI